MDVLHVSRFDDYWNVDGGWNYQGCGPDSLQMIILNEKPPNGYTWSGEVGG